MEEVDDEPLFCERAAGIDIGKAVIMVTIRVPGDTPGGRRQQETREFRAVRKDLLALADWLRCWQVTKIGMEATSDYWKPVFFLLEREGFDCVLYHASQVKALPGRPKTDKLDSAWLAKITERGSLPGSFVPPEDIRRLRTHTRYRRHLVQARAAEMARCEKLLEDAHLKLSSVISNIHGVSGREMLTAIIAGQRNPKVLAQMARTRMRGKITQLEEALDCSFFTEEHAFILAMMLANIGHLSAQISELSAKIEVLCEPYERQIAQLDAVPGIGVITAQDTIGESGSPGRFPGRGPLRTVRARHPGTRLKQAPRALRAWVLTSCVCGPGARGRRRRVSSGFGSRPACHARPGGRGTRRRSPCGPRSATTVPTPTGTGAGCRSVAGRGRSGSARPAW